MAKKYTADTFEGAVTGNVTGDVTGNLTGDVTGDVTGDLTGDVTGSASENVLKAGDTMTGDLTILKSNPVFELNSNNIFPYGRIEFAGSSSQPFEIVGKDNPGGASLALRSEQGGTMADAFTIDSSSNYSALPLRIGANATSNELDDYEEGTYTPNVFGSTGGLTMTSYTTRLGKYVKIGRIVHCFFEVVFTASVGSNSILGLGGLPFVPSDDGDAYGAGSIGVAYKNRWNFVYTSAGGADSLIGIRKLGTSNTVFFNMDNGSATNSMKVDALTGSTSSSMSMVAHITYRTTD